MTDFGRSLNPGRKHLIEFFPRIYATRTQPFGVGERLWAIRLMADRYEQLHPDVTIEFVPQIIHRFIWNSVRASGLTLIGVLTLGSIIGYIFARFDFAGKNVLFYAVISLLMIPIILNLVPSFMVVKRHGFLK